MKAKVRHNTYLALGCVFVLDLLLWLGGLGYRIPQKSTSPKKSTVRIFLPPKPRPLQTEEKPKFTKLERFIKSHKKNLDDNYSAKASNRESRQSKRFQSLKKILDEVGKEVNFFDDKAAKYTRNIIIPSPSHTKSSAKENGKHEKDFYFSGSSRINYLLPKRYTRHIPSPLYRCPGKGLIVIDIWVNQSGTVEKASVNDSKSTPDQCLIDVALESAFKTRFNSNYSTDLLEKGHISYKF